MVRARWREQALADTSGAITMQLVELDEVQRAAWQA
jgi:hypothetical protein